LDNGRDSLGRLDNPFEKIIWIQVEIVDVESVHYPNPANFACVLKIPNDKVLKDTNLSRPNQALCSIVSIYFANFEIIPDLFS
jgi:hypothetical protein